MPQTIDSPTRHLSARNTDPRTSKEAALLALGSLNQLQRRIYNLLVETPGGLTAEEVSDRLRVRLNSISPRTAPMEEAGLIIKNGTRRNESTGHKAIIWAAC